MVLSIHSCRDGEKKNNEIVILSRNNPPKILCSNCEQNEAKWVNPEGYYEGEPFWCDECLKAESDEEGEYYKPEFLLPVCNSPGWGCADMGEVTVIQINLSQMNNKIFDMSDIVQDIICELQDMKHLDWAAKKCHRELQGAFEGV